MRARQATQPPEKNVSKEIKITGLLSNSRTLDVLDIAVRG
jgi:hypothetical protein